MLSKKITQKIQVFYSFYVKNITFWVYNPNIYCAWKYADKYLAGLNVYTVKYFVVNIEDREEI